MVLRWFTTSGRQNPPLHNATVSKCLESLVGVVHPGFLRRMLGHSGTLFLAPTQAAAGGQNGPSKKATQIATLEVLTPVDLPPSAS